MNTSLWAVLSGWWNSFVHWLYNWQTLVAGTAAVIVAAITVAYLRKQIEQADRFTKEERLARLTVARAKLIVPSSRLAEHARVCFQQLATIEPAVLERAGAAEPIAIPALPPDVENVLDALLASADERNAAFAVSAIYGEQQVLTARASDMHIGPRSHVLTIDYYFMQPVIIHALAISLLAYARNEATGVEPIGWPDMEASTRSLCPAGPRRDRLLAFISDKANRSVKIPFAIRETND